jgi:hypothetical protein
MSTSIFAKTGTLVTLAMAVLLARRAYTAICYRKAAGRLSSLPQATRAGAPADAFSTHAIQHDLSIGDAV